MNEIIRPKRNRTIFFDGGNIYLAGSLDISESRLASVSGLTAETAGEGVMAILADDESRRPGEEEKIF